MGGWVGTSGLFVWGVGFAGCVACLVVACAFRCLVNVGCAVWSVVGIRLIVLF